MLFRKRSPWFNDWKCWNRTMVNKKADKNIILGKNVCLGTDKCSNMIILGDDGSNRPQFLMKDNIMQKNGSYIVSNIDAALYNECKLELLRSGYKVYVLDPANITGLSMSYDPLAYIKNITDAVCFVNSIVDERRELGSKKIVAVASSSLLLSAVLYLLEANHEFDRNLNGLLALLEDERKQSELAVGVTEAEVRFELAHVSNSKGIFYKCYSCFKSMPEAVKEEAVKMVIDKISQLVKETKGNGQKIILDSIANEKSALFIIQPQNSKEPFCSINALYSQLLYELQKKQNGCSKDVYFMMSGIHSIGCPVDFMNVYEKAKKYNLHFMVFVNNMDEATVLSGTKAERLLDADTLILFRNNDKDLENQIVEILYHHIGFCMMHKYISVYGSNQEIFGIDKYKREQFAYMTTDMILQKLKRIKDNQYFVLQHMVFPMVLDFGAEK